MLLNQKTLLATLLVVFIVIISACRKFDFLSREKPIETLTVKDAKEWYYSVLLKEKKDEHFELLTADNNNMPDPLYIYATNQGKHPVWALGEEYELSLIHI